MLLGGAALTRNYVERDLREVYEGRLFYGKDAFEGLRTMDTLMAGKRAGDARPRLRSRAPAGATLPPRKSERDADAPTVDVPGALRRRDRRRACSRRRSSVPASPRASRSTTSPATSTRPRCSATSGSSGPRRRRRERRRVQGAHPPDAARRSSTSAKAGGLLVPAVAGATSRSTPTATTSSCGRTTTRTQEWLRFTLPAPAQGAVPLHRRLLPARRVGRGRLRGVPRRDDGRRASASASRSCSPPTGTRSTCCCTACRSR